MTKLEILSKAKQIFFNTDMVRAILDGRKTQTRRAIKPANAHKSKHMGGYYQGNGLWISTDGYIKDYSVSTVWQEIECYKNNYAPYKVGDILYVRETWNCLPIPEPLRGTSKTYWYKADECNKRDKWHPSIHMPKEAARIFLRVTNVRVERLQEITGEEILKEGISREPLDEAGEDFFKGMFHDLWNSTVKKYDLDKYGWAANPWVWVIEFERID